MTMSAEFHAMAAPLPPLEAGQGPLRGEGGGKARAIVLLATFLLATPALADDKTACADGIAMIKDALADNPSEAVLPKLRKALRVAEREQGEREFDECLDAVGDARRAMGR